jgi:hypothetical protein
MEAARSSETVVPYCNTKWQHNAEDINEKEVTFFHGILQFTDNENNMIQWSYVSIIR